MALEPIDVNPIEVVIPATISRRNHSKSGEFFPADGNVFAVIAIEVEPGDVAAAVTAMQALQAEAVVRDGKTQFVFVRWPSVSHKDGYRARVTIGVNANPAAPIPVVEP